MDEVVADVEPKFLDYYEQATGRRPDRSEYWGKKIYHLPGGEHIRSFLFDKGFFADLQVMEGSQEVVRWLTEHYEVFFVSSAMEFPNSLEDKYHWAQRHFPFISWRNIIFCGSKIPISADYMIDDHAWNLEPFGGKALLFTAWHNTEEQRFTRLNDWQEVRAFFENELKMSSAI